MPEVTAFRGPTRTRLRCSRPGGAVLLASLTLLWAACGSPPRQEAGTPSDSVQLARADTLLSEVAGAQFARLTRMQRWRTVATLGTGLPPQEVSREELPEPDAMGAGLLSVYCVQCHWLPTPEMHSSAEWDILMRRMLLRARLLEDRARGEHIPARFTSGAQFKVVPTATHRDSMLAYLKRNALPVTEPGRLPNTLAADLYVERCTVCHETPSPTAHSASGWVSVLERMQENMRLMQVDTLSADEMTRIRAFVEENAAETGE